MHKKFESSKVWETLLRDESHPDRLTLFMAVPTIYYNLIKHYDEGKLEVIDKDEV
jgi:hypothetical protein